MIVYPKNLRHNADAPHVPILSEAGINRGGFTCYFLDPDDITLKIIQAPPRHSK